MSAPLLSASHDDLNNQARLALLDNPAQAKISKPSRSRSEINKSKDSVIPFNQDCIRWNARQITRKAKRFDKIINKYARRYRIDSDLVKAIITVESCFKIKALSNKGAQGLMQLIPDTAKRFGVRNSYNPDQNIHAGIKYLKFLIKRFNGNLKKVIAAYNAGEGKVDKHKGVPPYKETRRYVKNVLAIYQKLNPRAGRVSAVYYPPKQGLKPGRHGWEYNRYLAPQLFKH